MKSFGIAVATLIETVRQPAFFLVTLLGSLLLFASSWITLSGFVMGREAQIVRETGVAGAVMAGIVIVFLSVPGSIQEEMRTKQILAILAKPISGFQLALGKFQGLAMALLLAFVLFAVSFGASLWVKEGALPLASLAGAYLLGFFQVCLVGALMLALSVSLPVPAVVFGGCLLFVAGNLMPLLTKNLEEASSFLRWPGEFALLWLPNFFRLNVSYDFAAGHAPSALYLFIAAIYSLLYALTILLVAGKIISRKEIA